MCLIGFRWTPGPGGGLLLAANRDEFHARPTAPLNRWDRQHQCYAGRDLSAGGSWLAVGIDGRVAAVTNVREPQARPDSRRSRGALVTGFMAGRLGARAYGEQVWANREDFGGFNLLLMDGEDCLHLSNREPGIHSVAEGIHTLSNASLDTSWPKTRRAAKALAAAADADDSSALWTLLQDRSIAADDELPDTGVPLDRERRLSAPFIVGEDYGTRSATVVTISNRQLGIEERRFGPNGVSLGRTRIQAVLR